MATEVWKLVHDDGMSPKQAAKRLGVETHEIYELLAAATLERDSVGHRIAVLQSARARPVSASAEEEVDRRTKAVRLLDQGLSTRVICERMGRTERWLASVRKERDATLFVSQSRLEAACSPESDRSKRPPRARAVLFRCQPW
jgi:Homeodomain-like domain